MWAVMQQKIRPSAASLATGDGGPSGDARRRPEVTESAGPIPETSQRVDAGGILRRHLEGDPQAFGELVAEYRAPVYGYLVRCGIGSEDRDDLFQDIFVKVHRAAASYQPSRPLHPWLFTIVANTVRSHLRRAKVRRLVFRSTDDTTPEPMDGGADGERWTSARQRLSQLEGELPGLSAIQRQVLLLAGVEKLPLKDVAEVLEMPVNTVKTHLRRARLKLAQGLARRDHRPPSHAPTEEVTS